MPSFENYVQKIHKKLNNEGLEEHKIKKYLQELDRIPITLDVLKATGIGRAVNRYRKHGSEYIGDLASHLVTKWKELLKQEVPSHSSKSSSTKGGNNGIFHLNSNHSNHIGRDSACPPSASEVEMDCVNYKHENSKHETGEIKSKVTTPLAGKELMDHSKHKHMKSEHKTGQNKSKVTTPLASENEMDHTKRKHVKSKHKIGEIKSYMTSPLASEEEMDRAKQKHTKSKHKTGEIKSNMTTPLASDEEMDQLNNKLVKSKHKTGKINAKVTTSLANDEEMDHLNNKHVKSKQKSDEIKAKARSAPQLCDVSFGCEPVNVKQKKRPISTVSAAMATKMTSSESVRLEFELPPLPSSLSVKKSLLPEIQPTYKPIRMPGFGDVSPKKKKGVFGGELDENAVMSRKSRTQVFSGRKSATHGGVVTSLFDSCMKVLTENIDALDDTGGVPYDVLHPLLEKCNPQQLLHLEECNPYFIEDTEPLWEKHCCREFKGTKPERSHTWRELYMNNEQEREARLKKINEKIAASQAAKKPERQVKLAYVTTEAKPPPAVRRKQAKFGTGTGIHPGVPVTTPSRSMPQVHHRNLGSSPAKKQAVPAPMMKKTMKLFKNQRSRAATSIRRT